MALIETSLIWVAYAVCLAPLVLVAATFVVVYQQPGHRSPAVTAVCFLTTLALLATVLLQPVDIALTAATVNRKLGRKKDWATPDAVDHIRYQLTCVYYALYSLDALLLLLVVPFTYFLYEEYDEVAAAAEGSQTVGQRVWGALKYTIAFVFLCVILFLVGFFVPVAKRARDEHRDLDYFKDLLTENHGERALTFSIGILITIGTILYCLYTAPGLALLPLALIKSAPSISAPQLAASTSSALAQNRERQRQLELRNQGREGGLSSKDQRELESLVREERTLIRRERLAAETQGEGHVFLKIWHKLGAVFRPLKLIFGLLLLIISLVIFASMLITAIDKIKNSVCGASCGYLLGFTQIFNPINWLLTLTARIFPIDYVVFLLLTLFFFCSSVVGIATIGIRFLWVILFKIRSGKTSPNAMLLGTALLTLIVFALNYSLAMIVAPHYATFGPQTFCDRPLQTPDSQPDCSHHRSAVKACSERPETETGRLAARAVCTPSVVSTFLNRITVNFPFLGVVDFWAQFAFFGIFVIVFLVMLFRVPKLDEEEMDEDLREEEEEGLLASTGRRFGATRQDITGRAKGVKRADYGALGNGREEVGGQGSTEGGMARE